MRTIDTSPMTRWICGALALALAVAPGCASSPRGGDGDLEALGGSVRFAPAGPAPLMLPRWPLMAGAGGGGAGAGGNDGSTAAGGLFFASDASVTVAEGQKIERYFVEGV